MYNILNKLSSACNRAIQRDRTLNINKFDNLTVISSASGAGKNTLMKGIMLDYDPKDNFLVLVESHINNTYCNLSKEIMLCNYSRLDIETVLDEFEQTDCNNLFIEQYISCNNKDTPFEDLNYLRKYSKTSGKNVYICVHLPRNKLYGE